MSDDLNLADTSSEEVVSNQAKSAGLRLPPVWILGAGVLLGMLLGPAVLGKLSPTAYQRLFIGSGDRIAELLKDLDQIKVQEQRIVFLAAETDVTPIAVEEMIAAIETHRFWINSSLAAEQHWQSIALLLYLLVTLVVLMAFESVMRVSQAKQSKVWLPIQSRLTLARYVVVALVLALVIARPSLLAQIDWAIMAIILLVLGILLCIPTGKLLDETMIGETTNEQ